MLHIFFMVCSCSRSVLLGKFWLEIYRVLVVFFGLLYRLYLLHRLLCWIGSTFDIVTFSHDDLLVHVQLVLGHDAHRDEVGVNDRDLEDAFEAVNPEVPLLGRGAQKHEVARVRLQLEAELPRALLAVQFFQLADALDANYFSSKTAY